MNKTIQKDWIKALLSGEYRKCKGQLKHNKNTYCVMGVLCDLYVKKHPKQKWIKSSWGSYTLMDDGGFAPAAVKKWARLKSIDVNYRGRTLLISTVNDMYKINFKQMAKLVKQL